MGRSKIRALCILLILSAMAFVAIAFTKLASQLAINLQTNNNYSLAVNLINRTKQIASSRIKVIPNQNLQAIPKTLANELAQLVIEFPMLQNLAANTQSTEFLERYAVGSLLETLKMRFGESKRHSKTSTSLSVKTDIQIIHAEQSFAWITANYSNLIRISSKSDIVTSSSGTITAVQNQGKWVLLGLKNEKLNIQPGSYDSKAIIPTREQKFIDFVHPDCTEQNDDPIKPAKDKIVVLSYSELVNECWASISRRQKILPSLDRTTFLFDEVNLGDSDLALSGLLDRLILYVTRIRAISSTPQIMIDIERTFDSSDESQSRLMNLVRGYKMLEHSVPIGLGVRDAQANWAVVKHADFIVNL